MKNTPHTALFVAIFAAFVGSITLANHLTSTLGFIPVGFGLTATAGTLVAGATLALRDALQDTAGKATVLAAIGCGALISLTAAQPEIALASVVAFTAAELLDFAIYTPLRRRSHLGGKRWAAAVLLSNLAGALADTILFVGIAFGAAAVLPAIPGQMVGKMWAALAYLLIGTIVAISRKPRQPRNPRSHDRRPNRVH